MMMKILLRTAVFVSLNTSKMFVIQNEFIFGTNQLLNISKMFVIHNEFIFGTNQFNQVFLYGCTKCLVQDAGLVSSVLIPEFSQGRNLGLTRKFPTPTKWHEVFTAPITSLVESEALFIHSVHETTN